MSPTEVSADWTSRPIYVTTVGIPPPWTSRHVSTRSRLHRPPLRRRHSPQLPLRRPHRPCGARHAEPRPAPGRLRRAEADVGNSPLARRRAQPSRHVRHEARRSGRIPRHLAADPDARSRLRHHRDVPEADGPHRQVLDRPLAASRHRRPLRRRPSDADDEGNGRLRGEQHRPIPRHRRRRLAATRPAASGHAGVRRRAERGEHRPVARLLRRQLPRRSPQPVHHGRRSERAGLHRAESEPGKRPHARSHGGSPRADPPLRRCAPRSRSTRIIAGDGSVHAGSVRVRDRTESSRRLRSSPGSRRGRATDTAGTRGASRRCWPGDSSRRARRSSPFTSAAGIITGTWSRATTTTCRRSTVASPRCSRTWPSAACWTTCWSSCAANSAGRRG